MNDLMDSTENEENPRNSALLNFLLNLHSTPFYITYIHIEAKQRREEETKNGT